MAREQNLVLGAGKLFFDRWDADGNPTGEFYIGNTTSLTYSVNEDKLEHYSSDTAARERDASVVTRSTATVGFTTDDIQPENLAMMFKGSKTTLTEAGSTAATSTFNGFKGRWFQLGVDDDNPSGVRGITFTSLKKGVAVIATTEYVVDATLGRVFLNEDAAGFTDGDALEATFDVEASTRTVILATGEQVQGAMRYIADNTEGDNVDYFWPKIIVSPDGDYQFKGDNWNEMQFTGEVTKKGLLEKLYIDGRPHLA